MSNKQMGDAIDVSSDSPTPTKTVADQSQPRRTHLTRWLKRLAWVLLALLLAAIVLDRIFPARLPDERDASVLVVSRDGTPLRAFADRNGIWRYPVKLDQVSPLYVTALLNYEDRWFWRHPGVNPLALLRASGQWLHSGRIVSGGSTLTMQVARILETAHNSNISSRSAPAKLIQILRAMQLEVHLSKRDILTLYLNHAPFGGTIEGVEAASWAYLGKPSAQLSQAEAALLTVLPQSPSALRPDRHASDAQRARDKVLKRMADLGVWTRAQVAD
ncbi:MAG: transglycosylase domain-containing protein, partial [Lysobacteraceae bacterium]